MEMAGQPRRIGALARSVLEGGTSVAIDEAIPWALRQAAVRAVSVSGSTGTDTLTPPPDLAVRLGESLRVQALDGVQPTGTPTGDRIGALGGDLSVAVPENAESLPAQDAANNAPDESIAVETDAPGPWVNRDGVVLKRSTVADPRSSSPSGRAPVNAQETNDPRERSGLYRDGEGSIPSPIGTAVREALDPGISTGKALRSDSSDSTQPTAVDAHTNPEGFLPPGINAPIATDHPTADASPVHQPVVRSGVPAGHIHRVDLDASGARGVELRIEEVGERLIVRTLDPMGTMEARGSQWTEMQQRLEASGIVLMPIETPSNASNSPVDDRLLSQSSRHDDCYDASMNLSGRDGSSPRSSSGNGRTAFSPSHDAAWKGNPEDGGGSLSNPEPRGWWA